MIFVSNNSELDKNGMKISYFIAAYLSLVIHSHSVITF